jgi:hypothetical protein
VRIVDIGYLKRRNIMMMIKHYSVGKLIDITAKELISKNRIGLKSLMYAYDKIRKRLSDEINNGLQKDSIIKALKAEIAKDNTISMVGNPTDEIRYATQQRAVDLFMQLHTMIEAHYKHRCNYEIIGLSHYVHKRTANQLIIIEYTFSTSTSGRDTIIKDKTAYYYNNMGQETSPTEYIKDEWLKVDEK